MIPAILRSGRDFERFSHSVIPDKLPGRLIIALLLIWSWFCTKSVAEMKKEDLAEKLRQDMLLRSSTEEALAEEFLEFDSVGSNPYQGAGPILASPRASEFPRELLQNFGRLFSRENIVPVLACITVCSGSSSLDDDVRDYFAVERRGRIFGESLHVIGSPLVIGSVSTGLMIWAYRHEDHRMRRLTFSLVQGVIIDGVVTQTLKMAVGRERPNGENTHSFPSGHASVSFMAARVIDHYSGKRASAIAYALAGLVALSRLEKNKHFLSDAVAGGFVGYIVGSTVVRGTDSISGERKFSWSPVIYRGGIGVSFSIGL